MRSFRFLMPFALGALSMLALLSAGAWAAPGTMGRMLIAFGGEVPSPALASEAGAATESAPTAAPDDVPLVVDAALPSARQPVSGARLLIPVEGVSAASLVDTYEDARGQGRRHDAIDIGAPRGTPVLAVADGVVMKLFGSELGGTTLYQLAPDRRTIYYYAHLDGYAAGMAEGRVLRRGEVIGYVGDTGSAVPGNYHLHFEVSTTLDPAQYWGGVPQNPYPLLR
jgi:peptidoglycan LD-endopeptidase LytH